MSEPCETLFEMERYGFGPESMKKVKVCRECGATGSQDESFCRECGAALPALTLFQTLRKPGRRCADCDAAISPAAIYCPRCGIKL